jgi:gluconate 2-dehydrogenase gamma chain
MCRSVLSAANAAVIGALADRIFPADHHGPGATEIGVVTYLDGQLAGSWGTGELASRAGG